VRVAVVDTYYRAFQDGLYRARPQLADLPYAEQLREVLGAFFGTADSFSHHLRALGHEAIDIVADCRPLQRRWAAERRHPRIARSARAIARAQLRDFDADVVYCHNLSVFARRDLDALRREGRLVVGQIASPLPAMRLVEGFDLITTSFPHFVARLRERGVDAEYFRLAIDARVLGRLRAAEIDPDAGAPRELDVVFVGGVDPRVHGRGTDLLERICAERRVDVWGYGADALPRGSPIRRHFHGEAWGLDMYRLLARARIALNRHIDVAEGHANNMRLYEATGMGALLVTDDGANLGELFDPGEEVVTYRDAAELEAVIARYLDDDGARRAVAAAGQRRTLSEHTYERRMAELVEILEPRLRR
jgi:spore maturation protein CgeB